MRQTSQTSQNRHPSPSSAAAPAFAGFPGARKASKALPRWFQGGWRRPDAALTWGGQGSEAADAVGCAPCERVWTEIALVPSCSMREVGSEALAAMEAPFERWSRAMGRRPVAMMCAWEEPEAGHSMAALFWLLRGDQWRGDPPPARPLTSAAESRVGCVDMSDNAWARRPSHCAAMLAGAALAAADSGDSFADALCLARRSISL